VIVVFRAGLGSVNSFDVPVPLQVVIGLLKVA